MDLNNNFYIIYATLYQLYSYFNKKTSARLTILTIVRIKVILRQLSRQVRHGFRISY